MKALKSTLAFSLIMLLIFAFVGLQKNLYFAEHNTTYSFSVKESEKTSRVAIVANSKALSNDAAIGCKSKSIGHIKKRTGHYFSTYSKAISNDAV